MAADSREDRMEQRQVFSRRANPFSTALIAGLAWGIVWSLWDNSSCLLTEGVFQHLRCRFQAVVLTTVLYCLLFAIILGVLGLGVWAILALMRRRVSRTTLFSAYLGLAFGSTAVVLWLVHFGITGAEGVIGERVVHWVLVGLGGAALGSFAGWLLHGAIRHWQTGKGGAGYGIGFWGCSWPDFLLCSS
jgi:hypothetical protein